MVRISMKEYEKLRQQGLTSDAVAVPKSERKKKTLVCSQCSVSCARTGPSQLFCPTCSEARAVERKQQWAREHPTKPNPERSHRTYTRARSKAIERGIVLNEGTKLTSSWLGFPGMSMVWWRGLSVSFSYRMSKNHGAAFVRRGHIYLRSEMKQVRSEIILFVRDALNGIRVARNKLWVEMLVQKPDHKGDAINVLDTFCDAVKIAVGLDDRWFSVARLDWQIVKTDPCVYLGIGQESVEDVQICSYCGRSLPFSQFHRNRSEKTGVSRECVECSGYQNRRAAKLKPS